MRQQFHVLILFILAGLLLAACGGRPAQEPVAIKIDMTEYQFSPNQLELQVGQEVTLTLANKGQLEHELMIGRQVKMVNNRPAGYELDMFEQTGVEPVVVQAEPMEMAGHETDSHETMHQNEDHQAHTGFMVNVPKGDQEARVTFTVSEDMVGEWEIGCFLLEGVHYESGMKGKLTVKSS